MNLAWVIRRARAMGLDEVAVRLRRKVRDRVAPPKYLRMSAAEAFEYYFPDGMPPIPEPHPLVRKLLVFPPDPSAIASPTDLLDWELFGQPVHFDDPPNWRKNYVTGQEWPDAPAAEIDLRDTHHAGGVKWTWEPSRHQLLSAAARCYVETGREEFAEKLVFWLADWVDKNPAGHGIHWTNPLEPAVRVIVWSWCLALLREWPGLQNAPMKNILGSMAQQAAYVANHYSVGSSANNHFIGEVASLAVFGKLWPSCRSAAQWGRFGFAAAERGCLRQIWEDGVSKEQSFGYFPFVWEFYVHLALAGYKLSPEVVNRLDASARFIDSVCASSGFVPQVGDEDDGAVLGYLGWGWPRYHAVASVMHEALGTCPIERPCACSRPSTLVFPDGGYTVLRSAPPDMLVTFDHGPLGFGSIAAHGHADALSVTLTVGGEPVLVDPGAYCYHDKPDWRTYFRSTAAHNTICFDGMSQSEELGPFLWGRRASASAAGDGYVVSSPLYAAKHEREIALEGALLTVTDTLTGTFGSAVAHWHAHPDVSVSQEGPGTVVLTTPNGARVTMSAPGPAAIIRPDSTSSAPGPGWFSPAHGRLVPGTTVIISLPSSAGALRTEFEISSP